MNRNLLTFPLPRQLNIYMPIHADTRQCFADLAQNRGDLRVFGLKLHGHAVQSAGHAARIRDGIEAC